MTEARAKASSASCTSAWKTASGLPASDRTCFSNPPLPPRSGSMRKPLDDVPERTDDPDALRTRCP